MVGFLKYLAIIVTSLNGSVSSKNFLLGPKGQLMHIPDIFVLAYIKFTEILLQKKTFNSESPRGRMMHTG
jgi:hypothetical protein